MKVFPVRPRMPGLPFRPPVTADGELYKLRTYTPDEAEAMASDCRTCGAGERQLCVTATGMPASAPCPGRGQQ